MDSLDHTNDPQQSERPAYGLGNPNVQYQKTPWDVFLAPLALVLFSFGALMWMYDLSLAQFWDWFVTLFDVQ